MAKYTHQPDGSSIKILRDDTHVANYDPVGETVTYTTPENEKYAGPVGKVVASIVKGDTPVEPTAGPTEASLKHQIKQLQVENALLRDEVKKLTAGGAGIRKPERYADIVDMKGAPKQDPSLGDLTPEFIEWARKNFPKDVFERRYRGRKHL